MLVQEGHELLIEIGFYNQNVFSLVLALHNSLSLIFQPSIWQSIQKLLNNTRVWIFFQPMLVF